MKNRKYYLDIIKIIAMLFVIYNHSSVFLKFDYSMNIIEFLGSNFLSCMCKAAVPLFFMVSGALLLQKQEDIKTVYRKRVCRMIVITFLFSLLYYIKITVKSGNEIDLAGFFKSIIQGPIYLPYWFLYAYILFLALIPFLRAFAAMLTQNLFLVFLCVVLCLGCVIPFFERISGIDFYDGLIPTGLLAVYCIFPILGYGVDQYAISVVKNKTLSICLSSVAAIVMVILSMTVVWQDYLSSGRFTESGISYGTIPISIAVFWLFKVCFDNMEQAPQLVKKILHFFADCSMGVFFLDGFVGTNGRMDSIMNTFAPITGVLIGCLVEIIAIYLIRVAIVGTFLQLKKYGITASQKIFQKTSQKIFRNNC